jgi:hypothetical protein
MLSTWRCSRGIWACALQLAAAQQVCSALLQALQACRHALHPLLLCLQLLSICCPATRLRLCTEHSMHCSAEINTSWQDLVWRPAESD